MNLKQCFMQFLLLWTVSCEGRIPQWEQNPQFYLSLNSPSWAQNSIQFSFPWTMWCPVWRPIFVIQFSLLGNGCEKMLHPGTIKEKQGWDKLKLGSFSTHIFEKRTGNRNEQFSLTTFLHTAILTLLSSFSPLGMISIKTLGDTTVLACKMFSSGCRPHVKNSCA